MRKAFNANDQNRKILMRDTGISELHFCMQRFFSALMPFSNSTFTNAIQGFRDKH